MCGHSAQRPPEATPCQAHTHTCTQNDFEQQQRQQHYSLCLVRSRTLPADAARELDVLGHDRDALGVDGAQVRVLEQADEVRLGRLLQREDGRRLEAQVGLEVLRDLADEALERELADEELGRF